MGPKALGRRCGERSFPNEQSKKGSKEGAEEKDPAPYLVGAGLVLVVLLWLSASAEREPGRRRPDGAEEPVSQESQGPVEAQETGESRTGGEKRSLERTARRFCGLLARNPETYDFVAGYPGTYDLDADLEEDYTPGEIPHLFEWDTRWGYYSLRGNRVQDLPSAGTRRCLWLWWA